MSSEYNGGLTREQFLFYEMRVLASLIVGGLSDEEAINKIVSENLFQFPTERMLKTVASGCMRRIRALDNYSLLNELATGSFDVAKQINLYAMMKQNKIVWDFMITVIGEKYRTQDYEFSNKDLNVFMLRLCEQNDDVGKWSEATLNKIKQVLRKCLVECDYLDNARSIKLNTIYISPELEAGIVENNDQIVFPAFNYFK